jgi:hypothetical protein
MMGDVADRHPARVKADDHVIQAAGPARALGHQTRRERTVPVPRNAQVHLAGGRSQRLRIGPVARVRQSIHAAGSRGAAGQLLRQHLTGFIHSHNDSPIIQRLQLSYPNNLTPSCCSKQ